jgi:DNA-binding GntR family transcriptional regulator
MPHRVLPPSKNSHVGRICQEIKWRIVYGIYRPGMHLSEATLARLHHASRTPVREALSRLSQDGYVEWVPNGGYLIAPVTVSVVRNIIQVRRVLEGAAAAMAALTATSGEVRRMRSLAEYHYKPGSTDSYRQSLGLNMNFHLALAEASHNDLLVDMVRNCLMHVDRILSLGADFKPFESGSSEEHHLIVEAVERHNSTLARKRLEKHLDRTSALIMENVMGGAIHGVVI